MSGSYYLQVLADRERKAYENEIHSLQQQIGREERIIKVVKRGGDIDEQLCVLDVQRTPDGTIIFVR